MLLAQFSSSPWGQSCDTTPADLLKFFSLGLHFAASLKLSSTYPSLAFVQWEAEPELSPSQPQEHLERGGGQGWQMMLGVWCFQQGESSHLSAPLSSALTQGLILGSEWGITHPSPGSVPWNTSCGSWEAALDLPQWGTGTAISKIKVYFLHHAAGGILQLISPEKNLLFNCLGCCWIRFKMSGNIRSCQIYSIIFLLFFPWLDPTCQ